MVMQAMKTFVAYAAGVCECCGGRFERGATLAWGKAKGARCHVECVQPVPVVDVPRAAFVPLAAPSAKQAAIFDAVERTADSLLIEAVAGSGKTTTIVNAAYRLPRDGKYLFLAFNASIAKELGDHLPEWVQAGTFHAVSYRTWRRNRRHRHNDPTDTKVRAIWRDWCDEGEVTPVEDRLYAAGVNNLVSKAKNAGVGVLVADEPATWMELVQRFDISFEDDKGTAGAVETGIEFARNLLKASTSDTATLDFDDMLYMPLYYQVPFERYDAVFVDESQDTNRVQRAILHKLLKPGGRLIAVGDSRQAIYGFRGADSDAMDIMAAEFGCTRLPLDITYRCPKAVVQAARQYVSHITAADTAPDGLVSEMLRWNVADFQPTDAVLCRNTAPLVSMAYRLLACRIPCKVLGREIGKGLVALVNRFKATSVEELVTRLQTYRDEESARLMAAMKEEQAQALEDKVASILAAIDALQEPRTVPALLAFIESIFSDDDKADRLTLATCHKSKGLEWKRVFILDRDLMPSRFARQDWQKVQEYNLLYVAYTRSMDRLHFINSSTVEYGTDVPSEEAVADTTALPTQEADSVATSGDVRIAGQCETCGTSTLAGAKRCPRCIGEAVRRDYRFQVLAEVPATETRHGYSLLKYTGNTYSDACEMADHFETQLGPRYPAGTSFAVVDRDTGVVMARGVYTDNPLDDHMKRTILAVDMPPVEGLHSVEAGATVGHADSGTDASDTGEGDAAMAVLTLDNGKEVQVREITAEQALADAGRTAQTRRHIERSTRATDRHVAQREHSLRAYDDNEVLKAMTNQVDFLPDDEDVIPDDADPALAGSGLGPTADDDNQGVIELNEELVREAEDDSQLPTSEQRARRNGKVTGAGKAAPTTKKAAAAQAKDAVRAEASKGKGQPKATPAAKAKAEPKAKAEKPASTRRAKGEGPKERAAIEHRPSRSERMCDAACGTQIKRGEEYTIVRSPELLPNGQKVRIGYYHDGCYANRKATLSKLKPEEPKAKGKAAKAEAAPAPAATGKGKAGKASK